MKPLKRPLRVAALALLFGIVALLFIEVTFYCLNTPIKQEIAEISQRIVEARGIAPVMEMNLVEIDGFKPLDIPLSVDTQRAIYNLCKDTGVPFEVVMGLAWTESTFRPDLISEANDHGMMQINTCNHGWLRGKGITDFYDPVQSVQACLLILAPLWEKYTPQQALMAYQFGEAGAREKWANGQCTSYHSRMVLSQMAVYEAELYQL